MDKLPLARNVIKVVALAVGGLGTVLCTMAIVGLVTDNGWARVAVAVVFAVALPAVLADRLHPEDPAQAAGATSDVFAFSWMAITLGAALGAGAVTRPVLAAEGDRLARADMEVLARALYILAGVTPTPAGAEPSAVETTPSATSSAEPADTIATAAAVPFQGPVVSTAESAEENAPLTAPSGETSPSRTEAQGEAQDEEADEPPPRKGDDEVFALALPSLVTVTADGPAGLRGGSGVFVAADRVATCRHFFDEATSVSLSFPSSRDPIEALTIVGEHAEDDLVIVRFAPPEHARPAAFPFVSDDPAPVDRVVVVGDPVGLGPTLFTTVVSGRESSTIELPVPLADSHLGSPIYDDRGQLRGIVTGPERPRVIATARIAELIDQPLARPHPVGAAPTKP